MPTPTTSFPTLDIRKVGIDAWSQAFKDNFAALQLQDQKAKEEGKLVGRYVEEGVADGAAYYVVVAEMGPTVRIRRASGLGDEYSVSYWGDEALIERLYAVSKIEWRDTYTTWAKKVNSEKK